jgi:lipoprotein-anchoring transpeptidase ErfK/SrfK
MQEIHVYRGGVRIGRASISSGKAGHDTPVGAFPILQKRKVHHSSLYDDAPMPFMQRLTWDGIALHAGRNPGYPASHGCIRLPREFAEALFDVTDHGQVVVVADYTMFGDDVLAPGRIAPASLLAVARSAQDDEDGHGEDIASAGI